MQHPDVDPGESPTEYYRRKQHEAVNLAVGPTGEIIELEPESEEAPAEEAPAEK
jgi:hypothetical protein